MRAIDILRMRLRSLMGRKALERELDEELSFHLDGQTEEFITGGMNPEDARHAALRSIRDLDQRREECRDMRGVNLIENLWKDMSFALRQLRANAGFTFTAIFVLALGVASSVAIYAFVDAALVKPLPYKDPARLVAVFETNAPSSPSNLSYQDYKDWKNRNTAFSSLEIYAGTQFLMSAPGGQEVAPGAKVSDGFFRTLGVSPVLGRDFFPGEDQPSAPPAALLSYGAWQQRYGGREDIVGQTVTLNGVAAVIVGVLPRDFQFAPLGRPDFWVAYHAAGNCDLRRSCHNIYGVARLREGVSFEAATANAVAVAAQLEKEYPDSNRGQGAFLQTISEATVGTIRPMLIVSLSAAALLLLIAGVNVMGLVLVRSENRRREIAIRRALGASPARLLGQFATEAVALSGAGAMLGLALAYGAIELLRGLIPANMASQMPFLDGLGLSGRVLAAAFCIGLLLIVLLASPMAVRASSKELLTSLGDASRGSAGTVWRRLGSKLVTLELATAIVLLVEAALLGQSLARLLHVNLGIRPDHLAVINVNAPQDAYGKPEQALILEQLVVSRMANLPGVTAVSAVSSGTPLSSNGNTFWYRVLGRSWNGEHSEASQRYATPDYFATLGATLIQGRAFNEADDGSHPNVVIINRAMAARDFPNEDPIGKQITRISFSQGPLLIVGVVEDIREGPLDVPIPAVAYFPFRQNPSSFFSAVVRTSQDESSILLALAATIRGIDSNIVPRGQMTMNTRISNSPSAYLHRSLAWLVGAYAGLALLLSVVGTYGVVAYSVGRRSRELGIRITLGAERRAIYRLILGEVGWLTAVGLGIGMALSIAAAALMRDLLFGVQPWDAPTLVGTAMVLCISTLMASFIPARRAASVNPVEAMRVE